MRFVRILAAVVFVCAVFGSPAMADTTPSVSIGVSATQPVQPTPITVSGRVRVRSGTVVTLQRHLGSGWETTRRATVSNGRYRVAYVPAVGRNRLRVVVPATRSTKRSVSPRKDVVAQLGLSPARPVANQAFSTSGRLPTRLARTVELQVREPGMWKTKASVRSNSKGDFRLSTRLLTSRSIRIVAPRAKLSGRTRAAFVSPTKLVTVLPPTQTATPVPYVSGLLNVGERLTSVTGEWDAGVTLAWQWLRDGADIPGATAATYDLTPTDLGAVITVRVTGRRSGYATVTRTSWPGTPVAPGVLMAMPVPTVTGELRYSERLTAVPSIWGGGVDLAYQWLRDDAEIAGATATTYDIGLEDTGHRLAVRVTGSKAGYVTASRQSAASEAVGLGELVTTPVPTIDGSAVPGEDLRAVAGDWGAEVDLTYVWSRDADVIEGATDEIHTVAAADLGSRLSVTVTGTRTGYRTVSRTSGKTEVVEEVEVVTAPTPTITGIAQIGAQLTVERGHWLPDTILEQQWLRDGAPIDDATGETYTVVAADAGTTLAVVVRGSRAGAATASATSAGLGVPATVPDPPSKDDIALRAVRAALAASGSAPVDVFVGPSDSGAEGYAVSSVEKRWVSLLRDRLREAHQPANVPGGFGYADTWNMGAFPDYPVSSVNPERHGWYGLGRQSTFFRPGLEQSVTVRGTFTDLDLLYVGSTDGSTGVLGYRVDGGPEQLVDTGHGTRRGGGQTVRIGGLASGPHEVTMRHRSGREITVEGVMMYDGDTERGVRVWEGGQNGVTSEFYADPGTVWAESLAGVHPDLVVLPIGSNDFGVGRTPEETKDSIRSIIAMMRTRIDTDPSIVLMAYYDRATRPAQTHPWSDFVEMYHELAAEDPALAVFDLGPLFGPWVGDDRGGLTVTEDLVHPSDRGSTVIADALADFVLE